jgi:hypothetical protein
MSSLEDIIDLPANLEVKRALAIKMILFDFKTEDMCALLKVLKVVYGNGNGINFGK